MEGARSLTALIKQAALDQGFELAGVCDARQPRSLDAFDAWTARGHHATMDYLPRSRDLRSDPARLLEGVRSILAVGLFYAQLNQPRQGAPRIASYALGRDYHKVLRSKLRRVAEVLVKADPGCRNRITVDSAPILEREFAMRAGLGWFGKNTCLIDSKRGSQFVIGLLLTTAELDPDPPASGGCGSCKACVEACPTGAIVCEDGRWQVDARRCVSYLTIEHRGPIDPGLAKGIGDWTFGCDVCQTVCPFNTERPGQPLRAPTTRDADLAARREWPGLERLAVISDEEWDMVTRGSPVRRARAEGLRRNARINLENSETA